MDTTYNCVRIATGVLSTLRINPERMLAGLSADMLATDLAEYLVRKGVPFRETHHIAGAAVKMAEDRGCQLSDLTAADLKTIHPLFDEDVALVWDFDRSAEMRTPRAAPPSAPCCSRCRSCGPTSQRRSRGPPWARASIPLQNCNTAGHTVQAARLSCLPRFNFSPMLLSGALPEVKRRAQHRLLHCVYRKLLCIRSCA